MGLVRINNQLYKDINEDKELVEFFSKLSDCFHEEQKAVLREHNLPVDDIKPDFNKLISKARNLKDLGIETSILSTDLVANKTKLYKVSIEQLKKAILDYDGITFNDYDVCFGDIGKIKSFLKRVENNDEFIPFSFESYLELKGKIANFDDRLSKEKVRYSMKRRMFGSLVEKNQKLIELEKHEEDIYNIRKKDAFYRSLTKEQMIQMVDIFDAINNIRNEYNKYLNTRKMKQAKLEEVKYVLYGRAFERFIEEKSQEINMEKIEVKLLKVLYLNHLNPEYLNNIVFLAFDTDKLSFNVELVDWFVGTYEAELLELSDVAIENFDLLISNESSKILSKKNY